MTRTELEIMMGNHDRAEWVLDMLLNSVKPDYIVMMLKAKVDEATQNVKSKEESGYYTEFSDFPEGFSYWSADSNMQDQYDKNEYREMEHCGDLEHIRFCTNMWVRALNNAHRVKHLEG